MTVCLISFDIRPGLESWLALFVATNTHGTDLLMNPSKLTLSNVPNSVLYSHTFRWHIDLLQHLLFLWTTQQVWFYEGQMVGLKQVLEYSDSGRCQTSTRYFRATQVLSIYISYTAKWRVVIILKLTSTSCPSLWLLLCSTYLQYLGSTYFMGYARTYVFLHDSTYEIH